MSQGSKLLKGQVANLLEDVEWRKRDAGPWLKPERSDQETHQVTFRGQISVNMMAHTRSTYLDS